MDGCRDSQFFLEPQQTFHRQYEALRAVLVEGQPIEPVAVRFGYKVSALRSMVSRFRADRRCGVTPPFFARTAGDGPPGRRRDEATPPRMSPRSPTPASWTSPPAARSTRASWASSSSRHP
jgi:hypothetical protein